MKNRVQTVVLFAIVFCVNQLKARERAPLTVGGLTKAAKVVVVGKIKDIRVETESSYFEKKDGNTDWGIYLTIEVEKVEKGDFSGKKLLARCFRIKARNTQFEYLTPGGHRPIPEAGTRVRIYLEKQVASGHWEVVLPNGITSVDSTNPKELPIDRLVDASKVSKLKNNYSELSGPLGSSDRRKMQFWIYLLFIGGPCLAVSTLVAYWYQISQRRESLPDSESQSGAA